MPRTLARALVILWCFGAQQFGYNMMEENWLHGAMCGGVYAPPASKAAFWRYWDCRLYMIAGWPD